MKVVGLNNKTYQMKLVRHNHTNQSAPHLQARQILKELFPFANIYEEVTLPGEALKLDFFLPQQKLAVEVHGAQHYQQVEYFHKGVAGFINSNKRDLRKREWCDLNDFALAELPYNRMDEWKMIISNTLTRGSPD